MRIPLSWLRENAQVPADDTAEDVMAELVRVGLEEEDVIRPLDELTGPIVVGQVLTREEEPQKNGKTINWCSVRVVPEGATQTLTGEGIDPSGVQGIVCGAHNFEVGDKVVVTLPGAVLPGDFRISPRKTYGHVSAGMLASVRELGLGDDHEGIIVLGALGIDAEVGQDALPLLGVTDEAAEINVTPDRGYCFSIRGVAREYALATGTEFSDPTARVSVATPTAPAVGVRLEDAAPIRGRVGCDRFVTRLVTGVDPTATTPAWMAERLRLAGMRPISLPVDISNYVMLETGQPLHFYDATRLTGDIVVRRAEPGEKLVTLDGKQRELDTEDLLITDGSGPIGLAGIMGGEATEVGEGTTEILIESAHFDAVSMGRTKRRHKLPSEASKRNERGVDWEVADEAAQRAVDLLVQLAGAEDSGRGGDEGTRPAPVVVRLPHGAASARVGIEFTREQELAALHGIGAQVEQEADADLVTVPSWRPDITIADDLIEEIARLVGYEHIPSRLPVAPPGRGLTRTQRSRRRILDALAAAGLTEVLAYPFVSAEQNRLFGAAEEGTEVPAVHLANPVSAEFGWLRTSLLPGLTQIARRNHARGFRDTALFEGGLVFLPRATQGSAQLPAGAVRPTEAQVAELDAGLPDQPWHVAAVLTGRDSTGALGAPERAYDWADALDAALLVADVVGVELSVSQGSHQAFHPGRVAALSLDGQVIGYAGELHPDRLAEADLPERTVAMELDGRALFAAAPEVLAAGTVSTFPPATQDVALVVDADVPAAAVLAALREGAGELLEDVELFDDYRGAGIEPGSKSLAFALRFRAQDRTLTAEEASLARKAAVASAQAAVGATARG